MSSKWPPQHIKDLIEENKKLLNGAPLYRFWPGKNCILFEFIWKPIIVLEKSSNMKDEFAYAHIVFEGADVPLGVAFAKSNLATAAASIALSGSGAETHAYTLSPGDGCCEEIRCNVKVKCSSNGNFSGEVTGGNSYAKAEGNLKVCDADVPFTFEVNPNVNKSEEQKKIKIKATGKNGEVEFEWTWKKLSPNADTFSLKPLEHESEKPCKNLVLKSITNLGLSVASDEIGTKRSKINAKITNTIKTIAVDLECKCEEKKDKDKIKQEKTNEQKGFEMIERVKKEITEKRSKQIKDLEEQKEKLEIRKNEIVEHLRRIPTQERYVEQLIEKLDVLAAEIRNIEDFDKFSEMKNHILTSGLKDSLKKQVELEYDLSIIENNISSVQKIITLLQEGYVYDDIGLAGKLLKTDSGKEN